MVMYHVKTKQYNVPSWISGSQEHGTACEVNRCSLNLTCNLNVLVALPGSGSGSCKCSKKALPPHIWRYRYLLLGSSGTRRK